MVKWTYTIKENIMSAGITRVNSRAVMPSQRPSTVQFFNLTIASIDARTETTATDGVFDRVFRTAIPQTGATVAMIGTATYATNTVVNFAIETSGVDTVTTGSFTAAAMQTAVQALGTVNGYTLATSATVAFGVASVSAVNSVYGF
jgi:hypothetical protein